MMINRRFAWTLGLLLLAPVRVLGADYTLEFTAVSSFESAEVLASTEVKLGRAVAIESMNLLTEAGEEEPFYFVPEPGDHYKGTIYWQWHKMPHFTNKTYVLHVSDGSWSGEAYGDENIATKVNKRKRILSNRSFEQLEDGAPIAWTLNGSATISQNAAQSGSNSVQISIDKNDGNSYQGGTVETARFPLKPDTRYKLSYWFKIVERNDTGHGHQSVSGQLRFYDQKDARRISRMYMHYHTELQESKDQYMDQWRKLERTVVSPSATKYGKVILNSNRFAGRYYVDRVVLEEYPRGQPVRVEIGELTAQ